MGLCSLGDSARHDADLLLQVLCMLQTLVPSIR